MSIAEQILEGNVRAASRLMRDIDDGVPSAMEVLKDLYPKTGRAYIIGITGPPGSGKSTLVDKMVDFFRTEGKTVGIVAVDPTSPFTGGAILGDRIRMQRHATDEGVFIRSLATRGYLGGLSRSTQDVINVMDAMGKDIVLVETVGVGQDEVEIVNTAHTSIVIFVPGLGDDIQAIKAGIIEIGDLFVINKSDREGADRMERDLRMALEMGRRREAVWEVPILKTEAISGRGIAELVQGIHRHRQTMEKNNKLEKKMREKARTTFLGILETEVMARLIGRIEREGKWETLLDELTSRRADPYSIAERLIAEELRDR